MSAATLVLFCPDPAQALLWRDQLSASADLRVAAISNSPASVRTMVRRHPVDLILADVSVLQNTRNGALRSLRSLSNEDAPLIMMVAERLDDPLLMDALRGGADSYHVMDGNPFALAESVQFALEGGSAISAAIARAVLDQFDRAAPVEEDSPLSQTTLQLTAPERQMLVRTAQGLSLAEQAAAEGVTLRQLGAQVRGIYRKQRWSLRANALSLEDEPATGFRDSGWSALQPVKRPPRA